MHKCLVSYRTALGGKHSITSDEYQYGTLIHYCLIICQLMLRKVILTNVTTILRTPASSYLRLKLRYI